MSFLSSTATRERATRPSRFIRDPEPAPHARDRRAPADRADAARDASTARAERGGESPARPAGLPLLPLLVLAAVRFVSVPTELLPARLLPGSAAEFRVGESTAGFLTAGYAGIIVVSVIPLVALTARLPRRPLLLAGLVAFVASNILLALSPNFEVAVGARMVGGAAHGLVWALMAPYVARIVAPERVGRAMAIVFAGNSIGAAAGAPVATALGGALGWRAGFLALALPLAVLAVLVLLVVPPSP